MQKCPQCNSLVADEVEVCPSCRFDLEIHRAESSLSPNATVALSPEQLKNLQQEMPPAGVPQQRAPQQPAPRQAQEAVATPRAAAPAAAAAAPAEAPAAAPLVPPTPVPGSAPQVPDQAVTNPSARMAYYLAFLSILPAFPIGLAALLLGIVGISRARPGSDPSRRQAWIGILVGGFFGGLWAAATVYLLNA